MRYSIRPHCSQRQWSYFLKTCRRRIKSLKRHWTSSRWVRNVKVPPYRATKSTTQRNHQQEPGLPLFPQFLHHLNKCPYARPLLCRDLPGTRRCTDVGGMRWDARQSFPSFCFFLSRENGRKRCVLYYACNDLSRIECREMWKIVENVEKCGHCGVNVEKCVGWH